MDIVLDWTILHIECLIEIYIKPRQCNLMSALSTLYYNNLYRLLHIMSFNVISLCLLEHFSLMTLLIDLVTYPRRGYKMFGPASESLGLRNLSTHCHQLPS